MQKQLSLSNYLAIGFMLFALFFGAGNLIFPAQLGQLAGNHLWPAIFGFLITGVGLPLVGILAMSFSGSKHLQELASRVHPLYGVFFTALLYLTIGPFFAAPRTGTVAFEIGIAPFLAETTEQLGLLIFTIIYFLIVLFFSLFPGKIVDNIGKMLAPVLVTLLLLIILLVVINPMGEIQSPQDEYITTPFVKGFLEGYNTMDALAALVFGIIVINVIRAMGITERKQIALITARTGIIAITLLAVIYVGISYLGATSTQILGVFDTGGPVLSGAAAHYFGTFGSILLAVVIILACLTTAIGLITANSEYFHTLFPQISYRSLVFFFTALTFVIANFGLKNIINYSIPVLMFLYPLAMVLMLLTFLSPLFNHARIVYVASIGVTFLISVVDGLLPLYDFLDLELSNWLASVVSFYGKYLPLYQHGLGWLTPALVMILITGAFVYVTKSNQLIIKGKD